MNELERYIIQANDAYRRGEPIISDEEYDYLLEKLKEEVPHSQLLKKAVIERGGEEELPLPMFSLEKVHTHKEITRWLSQFSRNEKIVLMPKYDGISLLSQPAIHGKCWTRGDGNRGWDVRDRFPFMNLPSQFKRLHEYCSYCWGEAIMRRQTFEKYRESGLYKTARNMVAGLFNGDKFEKDYVHDIDYMVYGMDSEENKSDQLSHLNIVYRVMTVDEITESFNRVDDIFTQLYNEWGGEYNIDGIVMEVDSTKLRTSLGRLRNGNPRYSIAVKYREWSDAKEVMVTGITWNVGKDGYLTPIINIEPTLINGVTVANVTGHNASYLIDNYIAKGSVIKVMRSGDVIPKHVKTISYNKELFSEEMDDMMVCPSCGGVVAWDSSITELVCRNKDCKAKNIAQLVFFFSTTGIENMGEPTLRKLYEGGFTTPLSILEIGEAAWCGIDGLGLSSYRDFRKQVNGLNESEIPMARVLTALNTFHGSFGEKTCQLIFDNLDGDFTSIKKRCIEEPGEVVGELCGVKGVGEITANIFVTSMADAEPIYFKNIYLKKTNPERRGINVCFTGVRDRALEEELIGKGCSVVSGVSKNTNLLIVKDLNSTSSKMKKAQDLGIRVIAIEDKQAILDFVG